MKIKKIEVKNLKAISDQQADFNGCSAIITAGNNKGKTTFLRGLIDRFRSEKPDIIVREGEEKGFYSMELTDGSRIEWNFTEKSESFAFITKDGFKQTTGVLKSIGDKYFGMSFDIDKFLISSPKIQSAMLVNLVGLDFTEIDQNYKIAYDLRTDANKEVQRLRAIAKQRPVQVEKPNIEGLKNELGLIQSENFNMRKKWISDNEIHQRGIMSFNSEQLGIKHRYEKCLEYQERLQTLLGTEFEQFIKYEDSVKFVNSLPQPKDEKPLTTLPEPNYKSEIEINQKIEQANEQLRKFDAYERELIDFNEWVKQGKAAAEKANECDQKVKEIESEKMKMISSANIPDEFSFTEDGILFNGLPLSNAQISSSSKYIAALKLGSMALGEIKALHFDASFLDKNSLLAVEKWAADQGLQLLIERPDFDGGEIKYEII